MESTTHYVGIDVSKAFFDVCIEDNGCFKHYQFTNDTKGSGQLLELIRSGKCHLAMEASGPYYLKLATYLYDQGISVSVVNPLVIRRFCQMRMSRAKTDKKDAKMIALYAKAEQPQLWVPDQSYVLELRQLQATIDGFNKSRTAIIRQREAFVNNTAVCKEALKALEAMQQALEKQIARLETKMVELTQSYHSTLFSNLLSIPGLGKKTAMLLIVTTGGFKKFSNAKQLSAYFGLSPRIFESGTSVRGRTKISKLGMSRVRTLLYLCAWSAKRCNKTCKELYDRLLENGKAKRLALVAVANKLIKQAFAIATQNTTYQPN